MSTHPDAWFRTRVEPSQSGPGWLARWLRRRLGAVPLQVELWDGRRFPLSDSPLLAGVRFRSPRALLEVALDPARGFGEAYRRGEVEVQGDLTGVLEAAFRLQPARLPRVRRSRRTARRAKRQAQQHYDLGNEFFRLWLDEQMVYSCAYFEDPEDDLETAQLAKMEHICRKLRLRPGETVLDVGCGWGALARHMAARYGARVTACNVSPEQVRYARARTEEQGLSDRVRYVLDDFRNVKGAHDAFVSVGMLEHVGGGHYLEMGRTARECLAEGGRGVLHFIGRTRPQRVSRWIRRRIFPGTHAPALSEVMERLFEPWDLSVTDVENLRQHYARTLALWRERFERHADRVAARFDPAFVRSWRLYLAGSEAAFASGDLQVFQVTFSRERDAPVPWTRAALYAQGEREEAGLPAWR